MIEAINLTKTYRRRGKKLDALKGVSFEIEKGAFAGITGESGSGKSTLINILGGLLRPTEGSLVIGGRDVYKMKDRELSSFRNKTVGFVFQSFNLLEDYTALENVMLPLIIGRVPRKKRKALAEAALERVGLKNRMKHKPGELSGGQKQRVAVARAIVNSPGIIIADEPTGNLDPSNAIEIMELLKEINKSGVTILTVTHSREFLPYFDKNIVIAKGSVEGINQC